MSSQSETKKSSIVKCSNFNIDKFVLTEFMHNNTRSAGQSVAFPRYDDAFFLCITNPIQMTYYGITPLGPYVQNDKDRSYIKVGYDDQQESCIELFDMLKSIDEKFSKLETLPTLENGEVWEYVSLVRDPIDQRSGPASLAKYDNLKNDSNKILPKYCKFKLETDFEHGNLSTKIFVKGQPKKVETVTELTEDLKWLCTAKYAINFNKLWVASKSVNGVRKYGLTVKAMQIDITDQVKKRKLNDEFENYVF